MSKHASSRLPDLIMQCPSTDRSYRELPGYRPEVFQQEEMLIEGLMAHPGDRHRDGHFAASVDGHRQSVRANGARQANSEPYLTKEYDRK
jgi:hypothetical protein